MTIEQSATEKLWQEQLEKIEAFLSFWEVKTKTCLNLEQKAQVYNLFCFWRQQQNLAESNQVYLLRLAPLLCSNSQQRAEFDQCWNSFWSKNDQKSSKQKTEPSQPTSKPDTPRQPDKNWYDQGIRKLKKRYSQIFLLLISLIIVLLAGGYTYQKKNIQEIIENTPITEEKCKQLECEPPDPITDPNPKKLEKPYLQVVPKRQPPPTLKLSETDRQKLAQFGYLVMGMAFVLLAFGMMMIWWARRVMFQDASQSRKSGEQIPYKVNKNDLGNELIPGFHNTLARLRFTTDKRNKIHWPKTVEATAKQAGYPRFQYYQPRRQQEFVLICDSRHLRDQSAWLIRRLATVMGKAQMRVHFYDFDRHPQWLWQQGQRNQSAQALKEVLDKHRDQRFLIMLDHDVLFNRFSRDMQDWVQQLSPLSELNLGLLSQPNRYQSEQLEKADYQYSVINQQTNLQALLEIDPKQKNVTESKSQDFDREWLIDSPPDDCEPVYQWLAENIGEDGLRLFAAMALYPKLHGDLSYDLYHYLSHTREKSAPAIQPATLLKTLTIPWCRQGWLPYWLRQGLIKKLSDSDFHQLCKYYQQLFSSTYKTDNLAIELDIAKPAGFWQNSWIRKLINNAGVDSPLRDAIFAKTLLAPRSRLGELILPRRLLQVLPNAALSYWIPLTMLTLVVVTGLVSIYSFWEKVGRDVYAQQILVEKKWQHQQTTVQINFHSHAQVLLEPIGESLMAAGFKIVWNQDDSVLENSIKAPAEMAKQLLQISQYTSWGEPFKVFSEAKNAQITLAKLPQTGTVFRDRLSEPSELTLQYPDSLKWQLAKQIKEVDGSTPRLRAILPKMVQIPVGKFNMGSDEKEKGRSSDEGPVRTVLISAFEIAESELTFAEWDVCVKDKACKEVSDEGWGRDQRPVINVSWNDAQTYINWLNKRVGYQGKNRYRLPTEAEWEYAARGKTQTAYYWGEDWQCGYANGWNSATICDDGFENETAPVKSYQPNEYGLYDTAGNVWEWVEDCWHDDYKNAPKEGSAWLGSTDECKLRSIRGGGWNSIPSTLRAAYRLWIAADNASINSGFRLARTP